MGGARPQTGLRRRAEQPGRSAQRCRAARRGARGPGSRRCSRTRRLDDPRQSGHRAGRVASVRGGPTSCREGARDRPPQPDRPLREGPRARRTRTRGGGGRLASVDGAGGHPTHGRCEARSGSPPGVESASGSGPRLDVAVEIFETHLTAEHFDGGLKTAHGFVEPHVSLAAVPLDAGGLGAGEVLLFGDDGVRFLGYAMLLCSGRACPAKALRTLPASGASKVSRRASPAATGPYFFGPAGLPPSSPFVRPLRSPPAMPISAIRASTSGACPR